MAGGDRLDKIKSLQARVQADAYDAQGWEQLLGEISRGRKTAEQSAQLRATYEDLLTKFPTAASYWKEYAELEIDFGSSEAAKALFSRCLLACLDVDLWRAYLRFIRRINDPRGAEGLAEVKQAFEFTIDHVGQDLRSGPVWQDYITFLSAPKPGSPEAAALFGEGPEGQEDSQRTVALRRAYHRALMVPSAALDALWAGYERFEGSSGNKMLAKRVLDEWRPRFQAARSLVKERSVRVERIDYRALPLPPGRAAGRAAKQAAAWRDLLHWERSNPQRLDEGTHRARVTLAYEQALALLLHYPDIWLDYASWHTSVGGGGGAAAAVEVLGRGRRALPAVLALHFAAAEAEEAAGHEDKAVAVYESLVEGLTAEAEAPTPATAAPAALPVAAAVPAPATAAEPPSAPDGAAAEQDGGKPELAAGNEPAPPGPSGEAAAIAEAPPPPAAAEDRAADETRPAPPAPAPAPVCINLSPQAGTLAWVLYMRFARRTGGIMAARKLFLRARKWPGLGWEAFVASAQLEWAHEAKDQIPRNILELGLKSFLEEPGYVLQYAAFLQGLGDTANTRALFERALTATPTAAAAPLWDAYLRFEHQVGTLAAAAAVEQRRRDALGAREGGLDAAHLAVLKYKCLELWPGSEAHFKALLGEGPARAGVDVAGAAAAASAPAAREEGAAWQPPERGGRREAPRRRERSRSRSPVPRPAGPISPEPIRAFPRELGLLLNQLPSAPDGPVPDIEKIVGVILRADFSPEGIEAHEAAAAKERRRQRHAAERAAGGGAPLAGGPPSGFAAKRKAPFGGGGAPAVNESDSESSGGDDDGTGTDVYRRRMRARI